MKTQTLNLLFILFFFSSVCQGQSVRSDSPTVYKQQNAKEIARVIKKIYISYATNVSNGLDRKNDALLNEYMTPNLISKVQRVRLATQSDPVIRAQDFNLESLSTFDVEHLNENWYMVSYAENTLDEKRVAIPIRVIFMNKKLFIDYITPEWNRTLFGDSLLCEQKGQPLVDASTPLSLLKTFYTAYAMEYCNMPLNLSGNLDALCKKYCTEKALEEVQRAKENTPYYDLLIDYFDFDKLWLPTFSFTLINNNLYKISYKRWQDTLINIYVSVIKRDGAYLIDTIRADEKKQ